MPTLLRPFPELSRDPLDAEPSVVASVPPSRCAPPALALPEDIGGAESDSAMARCLGADIDWRLRSEGPERGAPSSGSAGLPGRTVNEHQ